MRLSPQGWWFKSGLSHNLVIANRTSVLLQVVLILSLYHRCDSMTHCYSGYPLYHSWEMNNHCLSFLCMELVCNFFHTYSCPSTLLLDMVWFVLEVLILLTYLILLPWMFIDLQCFAWMCRIKNMKRFQFGVSSNMVLYKYCKRFLNHILVWQKYEMVIQHLCLTLHIIILASNKIQRIFF